MLERRAVRKWECRLYKNRDDEFLADIIRKQRFEGDLLSSERKWVELQPLLDARGYTLRPRFHADWTPSWHRLINICKKPHHCSDFVGSITYHVVDAKRRTGQLDVVIKRSRLTEPFNELKACRVFQREDVAKDERNHCIRMLDVVYLGSEPHLEALLVFPNLFPYHTGVFEVLYEALDFFSQMFEGLEFMHEHHVAHRDICERNTMVYAPDLYRRAVHPAKPGYEATRPSRSVMYTPRRFIRCRYYYIDFDHATAFKDFADRRPVLGGRGQYRDAPEYDGTPCDGFKLDVWCLGYLVQDDFFRKYRPTRFMKPLVDRMLHNDPRERPSAAEANSALRELIATLTPEERNTVISVNYYAIDDDGGQGKNVRPPQPWNAPFQLGVLESDTGNQYHKHWRRARVD